MCKPDIRPRAELLKSLHSESVKLLDAEVIRRFGEQRSEAAYFDYARSICPDMIRVPNETGRLVIFYPDAWRILGDVADSMSEFPDISTTQVTFCQSIIDVPYANVLLLVHSLLDPDTLYEKDVTEALEQFVGIRRSGDGAIFPSSESALGDMSEALHDRWDEITQPEREVFNTLGGYVPAPRGNNFTLGRGKLSISRDGGKTFEELPYDVKSFSFHPEPGDFAKVEGKMVFVDGPDAGQPIGTTFPWPKREIEPEPVCGLCGRPKSECDGAFYYDEEDAIDFNRDDDNFGGGEPEEITPQQEVENAVQEFEDRLIGIISKTYGIPESFLRNL